MATRKDIRVAFYDELEVATIELGYGEGEYSITEYGTGEVDDDARPHITQESPNTAETFPTIAHTYRTRTDPMNRGVAPTDAEVDEVGERSYTYAETREIQFTVTVVSDSDMEKEDVYEALKGHFTAYQKNIKDNSELHDDVYRVDVADSNPNNMTDRTPRGYDDSLTISLFCERYYEESVNPTTDVFVGVDSENDGTIDETYTTT